MMWIALVPALVGVVVGLIFFELLPKFPWVRAIQAALVGGTVGLIVGDYYQLSTSIEDLTPYIEQNGRLMHDAQAYVNINVKDISLRNVYDNQLQITKDDLQGISQGKLRIPRDYVFDTWTTLVRGSRRQIQATNFVSPNDWKFFSGGDDGTRTQSDAVNDRNVSLTRVMIYDDRASSSKIALETLACSQKAVIGNKYEVREIALSAIYQNPSYANLVQSLGTIDVVLYDNQAALLTDVDPSSFAIRGSTLSVDERELSPARAFLSRVIADSVVIRCPATSGVRALDAH